MFANLRSARFVTLASRSGATLATERAGGAHSHRVCDFSFAVVHVTVVRITAERIIPFAVVRHLRVRGLSFPHRHSSHRQCHRRRGWSRPVSFRSRQHLSVLVAVARAVCTVAWAQPHRP
uniref:Uncharacterized protein n=1 Tax=Sipha flava TaxID=143950 RepID=A0A2S2QVZ3_9HEMI